MKDLCSLRAGAVEVVRRGRGSRPDVMRVRCDGTDAVLKDQNGCDRLFAKFIGPLLAGREARALDRLQCLAGVPELLGRPDGRSVLMEYIPATPITGAGDRDWPVFFAALDDLLDAMHEKGIAHCDLRSPDNTLIDRNGRPVLVDFVASVRRGRGWNPLSRWLFEMGCRVDKKAVVKLKSLVAPELISQDERHLLEHRSRLHRGVRRFGMAVRSITRRLFTRSV